MSKKMLIADRGDAIATGIIRAGCDSDLHAPDQVETVQPALELDTASMYPASPASEILLCDLAVLAAIAYLRRTTRSQASLSERLQSGWYLRRRLLT